MIGGTVGLVSSAVRAPDLQAGGRGFVSYIGHTFSSLAYFNVIDIKLLEYIVCSNIMAHALG